MSEKEQNEYFIKLRCGEIFHFIAWKELTCSGPYISLKIRLANEKVYRPHNTILGTWLKDILGVKTTKNYLILNKNMILDTNIDFTKPSSVSKAPKKKKDFLTCLGEFVANNGRIPTEQEKLQIQECCK